MSAMPAIRQAATLILTRGPDAAEVDFLLQQEGQVYPVEVKTGVPA